MLGLSRDPGPKKCQLLIHAVEDVNKERGEAFSVDLCHELPNSKSLINLSMPEPRNASGLPLSPEQWILAEAAPLLRQPLRLHGRVSVERTIADGLSIL